MATWEELEARAAARKAATPVADEAPAPATGNTTPAAPVDDGNMLTRLLGGTGLEAGMLGAANALTMGFGDEIRAGVRAPFTDKTYEQELEGGRAWQDAAKQEHGGAYLGGELAGALLPALATGGATAGTSLLGAAGKAAVTGAVQGGVQGFGEGEGGGDKRLHDAGSGALVGGALGGALGTAARLIKEPGKRAAANAARRTTNAFKTVKNDAYDAIKTSGIVMDPTDMTNMVADMRTNTQTGMWNPKLNDDDKVAERYIKQVEKYLTPPKGQTAPPQMTLGELERFRQQLNRTGKRTGNTRLIEVRKAVDAAVAKNPQAEALAVHARDADNVYNKSKILDKLMSNVKDETASTYSGTNLNNKLRQKFKDLVKNEKLISRFAPEEVEEMHRLIDQGTMSDVLRTAGRISPANGGLMSVLTAGLTMHNPAYLGLAAAGDVARRVGDKGTMNLAEGIRNKVAGHAPGLISTQPNLFARAVPQQAAMVDQPSPEEAAPISPENNPLLQYMLQQKGMSQ